MCRIRSDLPHEHSDHVRLRRRRLRQGPVDRHRARQRPRRDRAVEEGLRDRCAGSDRTYRMSIPTTFVSDAVAYGKDQLIVTERDNGQGATALWKKAFVIDVPDQIGPTA